VHVTAIKTRKEQIYSSRTVINISETNMSKAGMRRPDPKDPHGTESNHKTHIPKNTVKPVPEIQGKTKHGHNKAEPF